MACPPKGVRTFVCVRVWEKSIDAHGMQVCSIGRAPALTMPADRDKSRNTRTLHMNIVQKYAGRCRRCLRRRRRLMLLLLKRRTDTIDDDDV